MLLILNLNGFSQIDTSKICLPYKTARLVAIDLVKGDSALAELKLTSKLNDLLTKKVNAQDSIIATYAIKEQNYNTQLNNENKIISKKDEIIKGLEGDITELTNKNSKLKTRINLLGAGFATSLLAILAILTIK